MARHPRVCGGVALVALLLATSGLSRGADVISSSSLADEARCDGYPAAGSAADPGRNPRGGYVDYLDIFYCVLGGSRRPALGYAAMAAWLAVLFYLLADTAAVYFCPSPEGLARLLGLPPAIAGATLLSLGNGAPDALSALASFAAGGGGAAAVGLSGVLGGAMFVSAAVLGAVSLRVGGQGVAVDRTSFFRDAGFLLLALAAMAVVLTTAEVDARPRREGHGAAAKHGPDSRPWRAQPRREGRGARVLLWSARGRDWEGKMVNLLG